MKRVFYVSLSLFFIISSVLVVVLIYLLIANSDSISLKESRTKDNKRNSLEELFRTNTLENLEEWKWGFRDIGTSDDYPMVVLRDGYKYIRESSNKYMFGWKFEVLNVSDRNYNVTVNYTILDGDVFPLGTSSATKLVESKKIGVIQNTVLIPNEDIYRVKNSTWAITSLNPPYSPTGVKDGKNRFQKAADILKESSPYWVERRIEYEVQGMFGLLFAGNKWELIAESLGIEENTRLGEILKELEIDMYDIPPWSEIKSKKKLSEII